MIVTKTTSTPTAKPKNGLGELTVLGLSWPAAAAIAALLAVLVPYVFGSFQRSCRRRRMFERLEQ